MSISGNNGAGFLNHPLERKRRSHTRFVRSQIVNFYSPTMCSNGMESFDGDDRRSEHRGLHIRRLPMRSSDSNLRDGLFHEYKKHGKITSVVIRGQGEDRYGIVTFRRHEDAERALEASRNKIFFGTQISVCLHAGIGMFLCFQSSCVLEVEDSDLCPPEHAMDEYHPKATKTLFVGNLTSNTVTQDDLKKIFRVYGDIIVSHICVLCF